MAAPNPPTGLEVDAMTDTTADLSWVAPASGDAPTTYEYSLDLGTEVDNGLVLSVELTSLTPDTEYSFRVRSVNLDGASAWVEEIFTTPGPPHVPLNLEITTMTNQSAQAEWDSPITGSGATSYEYSLDSATPVDTSGSLQWESGPTEFVQGSTHELRVRSVNEWGVSGWSILEFTTEDAPDAPVGLQALNVTDDSAILFWNAASTGTLWVVGFEYSLDMSTEYVDVPGGTEASETLNDLTPGESYSFRVRAYNPYGFSDWSEIIFETNMGSADPPWSLMVSDIEATTATVSWAAPITGPAPTGYEYSLDFGSFVDVGLVLEADLTGLDPGISHHFQVRSIGEFGDSEWAEIDFSTLGAPLPPTNLTASAITATTVTIGWDPPDTGSVPTEYEYSVDLGAAISNGALESVNLTGFDPESSHSVRVRSIGTYGESTWASVSFTMSIGAPEVPENLVVEDVSSDSATLSWSAPSSGSAPTGYEYSLDLGSVVDSGMTTQIGFSGFVPGSEHSFRVRAYNGAGVSAWVELTFELNPGAPNAPVNLRTSHLDQSSATVQWDASPTGSAVTAYEYSFNYSAVLNSGLAEQIMFENLVPGSTHHLRVRSVGEFGTSAWSELSFTTEEADVVPIDSRRIIWDRIGDRIYEHGLDRGVLYLTDDSGVAWNGLVSVDEDLSDEGTEPLYMDGVKYLDAATMGDYSANLRALLYPEQFMQFEGYGTIGTGVVADDQMVDTFGLSYRTLVGNDTEGDDFAYKVHIVYNLTATPDNNTHTTKSPNLSADEFGWSISGIPVTYPGYRPTAHVILDGRYMNPYILRGIEDILYGDSENIARIPTIQEIKDFVDEFVFLVIIDNGDGTWTATGPDELIVTIAPTEVEISEANVLYLDEETYEISSS